MRLRARRQTLGQMATVCVLSHTRVTSALIGASRPEQITGLVGALGQLQFSADELAAIDRRAVEGGIDLWRRPLAGKSPA